MGFFDYEKSRPGCLLLSLLLLVLVFGFRLASGFAGSGFAGWGRGSWVRGVHGRAVWPRGRKMEKREPIIVRCVSTASQITIIIIKTPPDIFSFHIFNITQNNSAGACVRACVGVISSVKPPYVSKQTQKKEKEKRNLLLDLFQVNGFYVMAKNEERKKISQLRSRLVYNRACI